MKAFRVIVRILSITLLTSTLICGLYLSGQNTPIDPSSQQFHMIIGIAGIITGIGAIFLPGRKVKQLSVEPAE